MNHLALALISLSFVFTGLGICLRDVFKNPAPSMSHVFQIGLGLMVLGIIVGAT